MKMSYRHWIQFRGQTLGLVWQTEDAAQEVEGDTDCVLVDNGRIVSVLTPEEFLTVARRHGLNLEKGNEAPQALDGLERLLELPASDEICRQLLNAWNLYNDIARSVGATLDDGSEDVDKCYDKLFYGNNLESVTPAAEHYSPEFHDKERHLITEILNRGRAILAARL
jgi:hypothetical protein